MTDEKSAEVEPDALPVLPSSIRASLVSELASFEEMVDGLSVPQCAEQSAESGWNNLDVIAHVQLALALYTKLLGAGASGWTGGAIGKAFGSVTQTLVPAAAPVLNALNKALPHVVTGALAPEAVKGQLLGTARELRKKLEQLQSVDYTKPIYYRGGPWPVSFFLAAILNELALHRWDIESRLVEDAHLSDASRSLLPWFYWGGTSFMFRPPTGTSGSVSIALTDPEAELSWVIGAGGAISKRRGVEPNPDVTIRAESGTFILVLAGRIPVDDALRITSLRLEGDEYLGKRFLSSWSFV